MAQNLDTRLARLERVAAIAQANEDAWSPQHKARCMRFFRNEATPEDFLLYRSDDNVRPLRTGPQDYDYARAQRLAGRVSPTSDLGLLWGALHSFDVDEPGDPALEAELHRRALDHPGPKTDLREIERSREWIRQIAHWVAANQYVEVLRQDPHLLARRTSIAAHYAERLARRERAAERGRLLRAERDRT